PIYNTPPTLPEVDPDKVAILPKALSDEVDRAKAAKAPGWLRLLSQEVETRRFQWPALKVIGRAQWDMGDANGARRTYQKLIDRDAGDLEAAISAGGTPTRSWRRLLSQKKRGCEKTHQPGRKNGGARPASP